MADLETNIETSGIEDAGGGDVVRDAGGPPDHHSRLGAGQRVPGPKDQPAGSVGPFDTCAVEDTTADEVVADAGGPGHHEDPEVGAGLRLPGPPAAPAETAVGPLPVSGVGDTAADQVAAVPGARTLAINDERIDGREPASGVEDTPADKLHKLGATPQFEPFTPTLDGEAHRHFFGQKIKSAHVYDRTGEPWSNPAGNALFTGFAADGTRYTAGVQDAGPVIAPWSSEPASVDRSSRSDFPVRSLLVVGEDELVVFDLDGFPASLDVWMRFRIGDTGGPTGFLLIGRVRDSVETARMKNGVLVVATDYNGIENGGLFSIDFKQDGLQRALALVRSDNHWHFVAGRDITDRNVSGNFTTSGVSPSLRIRNEHVFSIDVIDDPADPLRHWVAVGGEDASPDVIDFHENTGQADYNVVGSLVGPDQDFTNLRLVHFDERGWLWWAQGRDLFRALLDYRGGVLIADPGHPRHRRVTLPSSATRILALADGRGRIYCGTEEGVYCVEAASMAFHLAYTAASHGGRGRSPSGAPGDGELLVGEKSAVSFNGLAMSQESDGSYLSVATRPGLNFGTVGQSTVRIGAGGVTVVRTHDDGVLMSKVHPVLQEDGAFFNATALFA